MYSPTDRNNCILEDGNIQDALALGRPNATPLFGIAGHLRVKGGFLKKRQVIAVKKFFALGQHELRRADMECRELRLLLIQSQVILFSDMKANLQNKNSKFLSKRVQCDGTL